LHRQGLLRVAEAHPMDAHVDAPELLPRDGATAFERAVLHPLVNQVHRACTRTIRAGARARRMEVLLERCLSKGPQTLNRGELCLLADDAGALKILHECAWKASPESWWGQALTRYIRVGSKIQESGSEGPGPLSAT
jgi:hypothetical protein